MTIFAAYRDADSLIYGIGNVGRQDDGLGWAFIDALEERNLAGEARLVRHYQLMPEDADLISNFRRVLFVDASKDQTVQDFRLRDVQPCMDLSFTSHAMSVASVLAMCVQCFGQAPQVQILEIRGCEWELKEGLSPRAADNLQKALSFFTEGVQAHV